LMGSTEAGQLQLQNRLRRRPRASVHAGSESDFFYDQIIPFACGWMV
jgi:hypothetical protein